MMPAAECGPSPAVLTQVRVLSYEPIGIVRELGSSGSAGGKDGSWNIGHAEAIFGGGQQWWICCVDGYLGNQYINITIAHLLDWPYIQNFWSQNFRFLTPHCLIIRVKVHFECKLDYHFTCLLCLCKFYFCPTCLNYITA